MDWVEDGTEPTAENFDNILFKEDGTVLVRFDKYQVAAGVEGVVEIVLPVDAIADLLTPEFRELLGVEADEGTQTGEFDTLVGQAQRGEWDECGGNPVACKRHGKGTLGSAAGMQVTYLGVMEVDWASLFQAKAAAEDEINCYEVACVALTFDDGPSVYTEGLLDILQEHEVQVTFFILGQSARIQSETVSRMFAEGHQIGNHTWNHPNLTQLSDESDPAADTADGRHRHPDHRPADAASSSPLWRVQ